VNIATLIKFESSVPR